MGRKVFVVGVGMTKFEKPGGRDWDYPDMARESGTAALKDAGISIDAIEQACVGYCYGDSTTGERAFYELGLSGIPVYNVNNNCSTGSTALFMAKQFVEGGLSECVMALGFEKMERGSLGFKYPDRTNPLGKHIDVMRDERGTTKAPVAAQMFGNAGIEHMERFGTTAEQLAEVAVTMRRHASLNPRAKYRNLITVEDVLASRLVSSPLHLLDCCLISDGGGALVVTSAERARDLRQRPVPVLGAGQAVRHSGMGKRDIVDIAARQSGARAFAQAGLSPEDIDFCMIYDSFTITVLATLENLGFCAMGEGGPFVQGGAIGLGGRLPLNPDGGGLSSNHPGMRGIFLVIEAVRQLREEAGERQVAGARTALCHGTGGWLGVMHSGATLILGEG